MIALALTLAALASIGLRVRAGAGSADASRATSVVRGTVWAFATLIAVQALLGFLGKLSPLGTAGMLVGVAAIIHRAVRRSPSATKGCAPLSPVENALTCAIAGGFAVLLWRGLHQTDFPYDSLSYHLHAPVTWMHQRRLTIVPAVFGDPAPAYAPSNVELWFLTLMSPLRSEYLAGCGQLPLAGLAVAAIVAAVREAGGHRTAALASGLAFLLIPEVREQSPTAMVDVGLAAFLLASVPFAKRVEVSTCAAALGLAVGSKFVGLVLALPFLALATSMCARRRRSAQATLLLRGAVVVFATGGFWYLRNLLVTGNPIFPGAVPGLHLPALYDAAAMRRWDYHVPVLHIRVLLSMLAGSGVGFATALVVSFVRRPRHAEVVGALASIALFWLAVPYQESRFLFPAFGLAAIAIGRAASAPPAALGWAPLFGAIGGGLIQGTRAEWVVLPAAAVLGWLGVDTIRRGSRPLHVAMGAGASVALVIAVGVGFRRHLTHDPPYGVAAWSWFRAHVRDTRVAYTGTNVAFPLSGVRLGNDVSYVNVAGGPDDRLHDFARRLGARPGSNPEPALYRDGATFDVWWRNLRLSGAKVLFISTLYPIVRRNVATDTDGFPIERSWADAHPGSFSLKYASSSARIYTIRGAPLTTVPP